MTLELGGKSANIVFADADLEAAAAAAPGAVFGNAGQDCCARSRILVQAQALDRFMELLEAQVKALRVGDPLDEATQMGPLISAAQREAVASFLDDGDAGRVPRARARGPGLLVRPDGARARSSRATARSREEVFGPIAAVIPFGDEAEAVALANDTIYGLSGSIWTRDGARALRVARARRDGRAVDQLQQLGARDDAVRGLQAVRLRARAGPARARRLHRGQDDLLRHGEARCRRGRATGQARRDRCAW